MSQHPWLPQPQRRFVARVLVHVEEVARAHPLIELGLGELDVAIESRGGWGSQLYRNNRRERSENEHDKADTIHELHPTFYRGPHAGR